MKSRRTLSAELTAKKSRDLSVEKNSKKTGQDGLKR